MSAARTSALAAARLVALRDLRLAFRKPSQLLQPLMFFMIVATLFPLSLTPEMSRLRDAAPGVLWVGALLSSLLALEFLFREDAVDGTLEQFALSRPVADLDAVREDLHALAAHGPAAGADRAGRGGGAGCSR